MTKLGTLLDCGCCGVSFRTWSGYTDQDQDKGYGICATCQGMIERKNTIEQNKLIECLADALNGKNRAIYKAMERELQLAMALQAVDEGFITYHVRRG
jgi:hypothetical protein